MIKNISIKDFETHIYIKGYGKTCKYGQYYNKPCDNQERIKHFKEFYSRFEVF